MPTKPTSWNLKKLLTALFFAAATFALAYILGNAITNSLGPGMSGFISTIWTTILVIISARVTQARGSFTLMVFVFTILAIPTNLFGPPGWQKMIIGLIVGFCYDLVWEILKRKKWSLLWAAGIATAVSLFCVFVLLKAVEPEKAVKLAKIIFWAPLVYGVLGALGAYLGNGIYDKYLSKNQFVKFIQS